MKKLLYLFLVVVTTISMVIVFSLTGCKEAIEEAESAEEETAEEAVSGKYDMKNWEGTNINIAIDDRVENQRMKEIIPQFEETTGIKVNIEEMPEATLFDKVNLDIESGTGLYDVIMHDFTRPAKYGPAGQLFAIDEFIDDPSMNNDDWFKLENFAESSIDGLKNNGKLYGLPLMINTNVLIMRADVLEEKGLQPPETMEDLIGVLDQITTPEMDGIGYRGLAGQLGNVWPWSGFLQTYGGKWFDENWKPIFNSDAGVKATEMFVGLLKDYGAEGQSSWHWAELQNAFLDGKLAIVWDCEVFRSRAEDPEISKVAGKLGTYYVPFAEETGERSTGFYIWGTMIPSGSNNKEAGWQFMQWWTSTEVGIHSEYTSTNETIENLWNKFENPDGWPSVSEVVVESVKIADPDYRPRIPELPEVGDRIGIAIDEVMGGEKTAKEALDSAAADVEKIMEEAGYY